MQKPENIPLTPGVYLYKDTGGHIIYVGKARHLKKRVLSYFRPADQLTIKTRAMMSHAHSVEFLVTNTEKEALLLEASLIKKHRPHYNIVLRDDKQYVLFRVDIKSAYPRLEIVRKVKKYGAKYFGPFTSSQAARDTWKTIHTMFALRRCRDSAMKNRMRPCLYHFIGHCLAPCTENVPQAVYADMIQRVILFLSGKSRELIDIITKNMEEASENLDFEKAASLRDQRIAIEKTIERQGTVLANAVDMDVLGLVSRGDGLALTVIFVRGGAMIDKASFFWANLILEDAEELLLGFLTQFYTAEKDIPARIVLPWNLEGHQIEEIQGQINESIKKETKTSEKEFRENIDVSEIAIMLSDFRGSNVRIVGARTQEDKQLVEIAKNNARETVYKRSDLGMEDRLAALFHSCESIRRIECVDVSHTSGTSTKVGLVVYQDGKPHRSAYRVWNIEGANGDDYTALALWAQKRAEQNFREYEENKVPWPHLLLIDGGRGQVNTVYKAFLKAFSQIESNKTQNTESFALKEGQLPFLLAGIAKARDENGHADRRAGNLADRIFFPNRTNPLPFKEGSAELLFLQSIRDATHDFSIGKHRQARGKKSLDTQLLQLDGIGIQTAKMLWQTFNDLESMKKADLEDILKMPGIGKKKAQRIWNSLQKL